MITIQGFIRHNVLEYLLPSKEYVQKRKIMHYYYIIFHFVLEPKIHDIMKHFTSIYFQFVLYHYFERVPSFNFLSNKRKKQYIRGFFLSFLRKGEHKARCFINEGFIKFQMNKNQLNLFVLKDLYILINKTLPLSICVKINIHTEIDKLSFNESLTKLNNDKSYKNTDKFFLYYQLLIEI